MSSPDPHRAERATPWKNPPERGGPTAVIDVDGVMASMAEFEYLIDAPNAAGKDWRAFHSHFSEANGLRSGRKLAESLRSVGVHVVYSTTRPEQFARVTWSWIRRRHLPTGMIMFRHFIKDGNRPDIDIKVRHWWSWYDKHDQRNGLVAWFDDDLAAITELRKHGCPAWHPKEFLRAVRKAGGDEDAIADVLDEGPEDHDALADAAERTRPIWQEKEDAYQAKRSAWFKRHQQRMQQRSRR